MKVKDLRDDESVRKPLSEEVLVKTPPHPRLAALDDPELFLNRELAWLSFNERVLGESEAKSNPLFERLKFAIIFSTNLDEFFMVRLSGLLKLVEKAVPGQQATSHYPDESDPEETLDEVSIIIRQHVKRAYTCLQSGVFPGLEEHNISIVSLDELSRAEKERLDDYFEKQIYPVLTPLAVDPAHPFPYLSNLSIYLAVSFQEVGDNGEPLLAFVEIPSKLNRLVPISVRGRRHKFILLEDIIKKNLPALFPWTQVENAYVFRVTRNLDYQLLEGEVKDLMKSIELELKDRAQKIVVRMEAESAMPEALKNRLRLALELDPSDVYEVPGILNLRDLGALLKLDADPKLKDLPFNPRINPKLADERDLFDILREKDVVLHHPYDSFVSVLEFLQTAAEDPNVLAIKQTLYRTGGDSPIIEALVRAAENGKQVTAVSRIESAI